MNKTLITLITLITCTVSACGGGSNNESAVNKTQSTFTEATTSIDTEIDTDSEIDSDSAIDTGTETNVEENIVTDVLTNTETTTNTDTHSDSDTESDSETSTDTSTETHIENEEDRYIKQHFIEEDDLKTNVIRSLFDTDKNSFPFEKSYVYFDVNKQRITDIMGHIDDTFMVQTELNDGRIARTAFHFKNATWDELTRFGSYDSDTNTLRFWSLAFTQIDNGEVKESIINISSNTLSKDYMFDVNYRIEMVDGSDVIQGNQISIARDITDAKKVRGVWQNGSFSQYEHDYGGVFSGVNSDGCIFETVGYGANTGVDYIAVNGNSRFKTGVYDMVVDVSACAFTGRYYGFITTFYVASGEDNLSEAYMWVSVTDGKTVYSDITKRAGEI